MIEIIMMLLVSFVAIFVAAFAVLKMYQDKHDEDRMIEQHQERLKQLGFMGKLNKNELIEKLGTMLPNGELEKIFYRAKNPWGLTIPTFQFIRHFGGAAFVLAGIIGWQINHYVGLIFILCGGIAYWYPKYYYKAIGDEREMEWNKFYEFLWVVKHNSSLHGPKRTFLEMRNYLLANAPQNKEMIQAFTDFYEYWDEDQIPEYISLYYSFPVPRELYQIVFNSNKTGSPSEESLNSLRKFIINAQDLQVNRVLSGVSGKATIFSLPFLMFSVILGLMVPLIMQIIGMM